MPKTFLRADRVGDVLQKEISNIVQQYIRDPRIGMININAVHLSPDLAHARVYVTFVNVNEHEDINQRLQLLNKASGFIRSKVAKSMSLRITPKLNFVYDESIEYGQRLSSLISVAIEKDQNNKQNS